MPEIGKRNEIVYIDFDVKHGLIAYYMVSGGARGVMAIVVGNDHGDTSSNPGWDWLSWERYESNYSPSSYG